MGLLRNPFINGKGVTQKIIENVLDFSLDSWYRRPGFGLPPSNCTQIVLRSISSVVTKDFSIGDRIVGLPHRFWVAKVEKSERKHQLSSVSASKYNGLLRNPFINLEGAMPFGVFRQDFSRSKKIIKNVCHQLTNNAVSNRKILRNNTRNTCQDYLGAILRA